MANYLTRPGKIVTKPLRKSSRRLILPTAEALEAMADVEECEEGVDAVKKERKGDSDGEEGEEGFPRCR